MDILSNILEIMHMRANQHVAQFHKIAVFWIFDFDNAPRILSTPHRFPVYFNRCVTADYGERNASFEFFILLFEFIVFVAVALRELINANLERKKKYFLA